MDKKIIPPTLPTYGYATVYVYPTVSPRVVIIPILVGIFGFPVLVLIIICALRRRARNARLREKRAQPGEYNQCDQGQSSMSSDRYYNSKVVRMKNGKRKTIVRFKPMPELDLDTVIEERSEFDAEISASDLLPSVQEDPHGFEEKTFFRNCRIGCNNGGHAQSKGSKGFHSKSFEHRGSQSQFSSVSTLDRVDEEEDQEAADSHSLANILAPSEQTDITARLTKSTESLLRVENERNYKQQKRDFRIAKTQSDVDILLKDEREKLSRFKAADSNSYPEVPLSSGELKLPNKTLVLCQLRDSGAFKSVPQIINLSTSFGSSDKLSFNFSNPSDSKLSCKYSESGIIKSDETIIDSISLDNHNVSCHSSELLHCNKRMCCSSNFYSRRTCSDNSSLTSCYAPKIHNSAYCNNRVMLKKTRMWHIETFHHETIKDLFCDIKRPDAMILRGTMN